LQSGLLGYDRISEPGAASPRGNDKAAITTKSEARSTSTVCCTANPNGKSSSGKADRKGCVKHNKSNKTPRNTKQDQWFAIAVQRSLKVATGQRWLVWAAISARNELLEKHALKNLR